MRQLGLGNRLLQHVNALIQATLMDYSVSGVAGHVENFDAGTQALRLISELPSGEAGHDYIGQKQINSAPVGGKNLDGRRTV